MESEAEKTTKIMKESESKIQQLAKMVASITKKELANAAKSKMKTIAKKPDNPITGVKACPDLAKL